MTTLKLIENGKERVFEVNSKKYEALYCFDNIQIGDNTYFIKEIKQKDL